MGPLRRLLVRLLGGGGAEEPEAAEAAAPAVPATVEPFDAAVASVRRASTWLVAALAAAGAALVGAVSFSAIGDLSPTEDLVRLVVAAAAGVVAIASIVGAIGCLLQLQYPVEVTFVDLLRSARSGAVARLARADRASVQGWPDASGFVDAFDGYRQGVWDLEARLRELPSGSGERPGLERRLAVAVAAYETHAAPMEPTITRLSLYEHFARVRRQHRRYGGAALALSVLAGTGVVVLAWAAGGSGEEEDPAPALAPAPESAVLVLNAAGSARYASALDAACLAAAADEGVEVVALEVLDDGVEVVVTDDACQDPTRVLVLDGTGTVTAAGALTG